MVSIWGARSDLVYKILNIQTEDIIGIVAFVAIKSEGITTL